LLSSQTMVQRDFTGCGSDPKSIQSRRQPAKFVDSATTQA
jgi:hypothetical protein